jgi:hypothetical protein
MSPGHDHGFSLNSSHFARTIKLKAILSASVLQSFARSGILRLAMAYLY